jgi:type II secretory pathway pseudopilin PulG
LLLVAATASRRREEVAVGQHRRVIADEGFSLLEATVALAVIAAGIVALTALALSTTATVTRARDRTVASSLADAILTELATDVVAPTGPGCLLSDVAGCVSYRDADGTVRDGPAAPYAVRWRAVAVPSSPIPATLLTVCAVPAPERGAATRAPGACLARVVMEAWP